MAEFQPDSSRFTTGDGRFNPEYLNSPDITLDPLPHDRGYFDAHLQFVKNYFETVSSGKLSVSYEVLPEIITLPEQMAAYSPLGLDGDENFKLANFSRDAWEQVRQREMLAGRQFDHENTLFIVFHAGAGRDLELTGTTLIKTPQDIPSVYLSRDSFQRLLRDPSFTGFDVGANTPVMNTAILPETQSRPGEDILGNPFVLELSVNGILTATVGSFLGLPDLFNTESGASAIGRFGLMDGAGFFSYFGLFPPEPSAWEKIYLGWETPVLIDRNVSNPVHLSIPAAALRRPNSIFKIPVTEDEYFLVENRHRDVENSGVTLTIRQPDGSLTDVTIENTETRFNPFDFSKISDILPAGVLVNVSNFDWSLPGGIDPGNDRTLNTPDDRLLNGGILIWHIDEAVIRAGIEDNTVNNNPDRPGIRLMEADGAQDIGQPSAGVAGYDQGNSFDFWWAGNDFTVITSNGQRIVLYQNRFGDDTFPNNRSHSGARTNFELSDFSNILPVATLTFQNTTSAAVRRLPDIQLPNGSYTQSADNQVAYPYSLNVSTSGPDTLTIIPTASTVLLATSAARSVSTLDLSPVSGASWAQPLITSDNRLILSQRIGPTSPVHPDILTLAYPAPDFNTQPLPLNNVFTSGNPSAPGGPSIRFDRSPFSWNPSSPGSFPPSPANELYSDATGPASAVLTGNTLRINGQPAVELTTNEIQSPRLDLVPTMGNLGARQIAYLTSDAITSVDVATHLTTSIQTGNASWPVVADIDLNGTTDFMFVNFDHNRLDAVNQFGAQLDGFPLIPPQNSQFTGVPLFIPATIDAPALILIQSNDGVSTSILIYSLDDLRMPSETLLIGTSPDEGNILIQPVVIDGILYALSQRGTLVRWELTLRADRPSAYLYGNPRSNKLSNQPASTQEPISGELLIDSETYNWPNPVTSDTRVRVLTSRPADISITIINYSGQLIQELSGTSPGSSPVEFEVNTDPLKSGVYFVRVTASSEGTKAHKVIKMVVIR